jgi:ferric iron reductase protein FhuF
MQHLPLLNQLSADYGVQFHMPDHQPAFIYTMQDVAAKPEILRHLVQVVADQGGNTFLPSAASMMTKQLARQFCSILKAMSMHGMAFDLDPAKVWVAASTERPFTLIIPVLHSSTSMEHTELRYETIRNLYGGLAAPLIASIHDTYQLKTSLLWENLLIYIDYYYKEWINLSKAESERNVTVISTLEDDYRYLVQDSQYPFQNKGKVIEHPLHPGESFKIRGSCCLRFRLPDGRRCTTCPGLKHDERIAMLMAKSK